MNKKFFKIVSILLSAILFIIPCSVSAVDSVASEEMEALSILPFGTDESDMSKPVSRAEFAYMASRLTERANLEKRDTRFTDVKKDNEYSGYIEFMAQRGIINGVSETEFNPEGNLSSIMAYKIIAKILGYDGLAKEVGGYPDGYIEIANYLGLTSVVAPGNENLTINEACNMIYEVLTNEYPVVSLAEKDGEQVLYSSDSTFSVLQRLKISAYTGYIRQVSSDNKTVTFEITKNNYETNYTVHKKGEIITLGLKNNIDAYHYENVPVSVCVDEDENIISIKENRHYEIFYAYITAVNGNENKEAFYAPAAMERISFSGFDDEIDVSEGFSLSVAGKEKNVLANICGSFAKVVLCDGDVFHVDSWPVTEGGIITEISADGVTYNFRDGMTKKLKNVADYKNTYVYINGERTDLSQLKKDSVFDYYISDDTILITCSEKVISEVFYTINKSKIEIGGMFYGYENIYYMTGDKYEKYTAKTTDDIYSLLGCDVMAYFGPDGLVRYIKAVEETVGGEFYGIVLGLEDINLSDEKEIKILKIFPEQEVIICKITENTIMPGNEFKIEDYRYKSGAEGNSYYNGENVFVFEKNSKNEIKRVGNPEYIKGYGDGPVMQTGITSIPDVGAYTKLNGKPYYFTNAPIVAVYESDANGLLAKSVEYNSIAKRPVENATLVFFGDDLADDPELVLLCGNLNKIGDKAMTRGVVMGRNNVLDANGDSACELSVLVRGGSVEYYVVPNEVAKNIPQNALVSYYKSQLFSDLPIYINSDKTADITKSPENWGALTDGKTVGLQTGKIVDVSKSKIGVENDNVVSVNCMHPSRCIIVEMNSSHPTQKFSIADISDIEIGDTVYYDLQNEGIETIIVIK